MAIPSKLEFFYASIASLAFVIAGYYTGIINQAPALSSKDLKMTHLQLLVIPYLFYAVTIIGAVVGGFTSHYLGRRVSLGMVGSLSAVGAAVMVSAAFYIHLLFGIILTGIGVGCGLVNAPMYIIEIASEDCRGFLGSLVEVFYNIGLLANYLLAFAWSKGLKNLGWRLMLFMGFLPSVLLLAGVFVLPEYTRWLVARGRMEEAEDALIKSSSVATRAQARDRILDIEEANNANNITWRAILTVVVLHFFQQMVGLPVILSFARVVFTEIDLMPSKQLYVLAASFFLGLVLVCSLFIIFSIDYFGRRWTLIGGTACLVITLGLLSYMIRFLRLDHEMDNGLIALLCSCHMASFCYGLGTVTWVYTAEYLPFRQRSLGVSLAVVVNRLTLVILQAILIPLEKAIAETGVILIFAGVTSFGLLFSIFFVRETSGLTLEEIEEEHRRV